MKYQFVATLVLIGSAFPALSQEKKDTATAEEKAARRLAELLDPGFGIGAPSSSQGPIPRRGPAGVENPEAPLPVYRGLPPRLPLPPAGQIKPYHLFEEAPLARYRKNPALPEEIEFPAGPLVNLPSVDVQKPIALPILAVPQADRASLADPSLETSVAAALAQVTAQRLLPVPFAPLNLPDPFEHSQAIRLLFIPDELPMPPPITPRTPAK